MLWHPEFSHDIEFSKLLVHDQQIDLSLVALEIARDHWPSVDFEHTINWLNRRAEELQGPLARARTESEVLRNISRSLAGTHGLHGDKQAFSRPESSYLNRVVETGVGIPISLSIVYMEVARRAGLELAGVASPMHFLTRFDSSQGILFVDPFHHGRILKYQECLRWLTSISHMDQEELEVSLEPARPRAIVMRMLNNLKALHVNREEWESAWKIQQRLTAMNPTAYDQQRDLGLIALKSNRPGLALRLFEACLKRCPGDDRISLERHIDAAVQQLSRWN